MSDYNWSGLDETLKRLEHRCPGLLVDGQPIERSRGCVLIPLAWLKKLIDSLDLAEARKTPPAPIESPRIIEPVPVKSRQKYKEAARERDTFR